jgi:hypothetical protein
MKTRRYANHKARQIKAGIVVVSSTTGLPVSFIAPSKFYRYDSNAAALSDSAPNRRRKRKGN